MLSINVNETKRMLEGCSRGVMIKKLDCRILISEFELQSLYCVHLRINTLGKGMNAFILPAIGQIALQLFF